MADPAEKPDVPQQDVDLDLDVLAPPARTFRFKRRVYEIPGDISVTTLLKAVQLREKIKLGESGNIEEQEVAVQAMFDLVMDLIRTENADVPELNVSVNQLMYIVGLILSGQDDVTMDEALIKTIGGGEVDPKKLEEDADHPPTSRKRKPKAA